MQHGMMIAAFPFQDCTANSTGIHISEVKELATGVLFRTLLFLALGVEYRVKRGQRVEE